MELRLDTSTRSPLSVLCFPLVYLLFPWVCPTATLDIGHTSFFFSPHSGGKMG